MKIIKILTSLPLVISLLSSLGSCSSGFTDPVFSFSSTPEGAIKYYIECYLTEKFPSVVILDQRMMIDVINKKKAAPQPLQKEEQDKAYNYWINFLKNEKKDKSVRKGLVLRGGKFGESHFYHIIFPGMTHKVLEIRKNNNPPYMTDNFNYSHQAFVEVSYSDPQNAPLAVGDEQKRIKKSIVIVYLNQWKIGSKPGYKIHWYETTNYKTEYF